MRSLLRLHQLVVLVSALSAVRAGERIEIDVSQVTQPSLAVSADGETLYFGLLGDLVALPTDGGEARVLTSGPAYDGAPLPTASGDALEFISDRDGADALYRLDLGSGAVARIDGDVRMHARTLRHLANGDRVGIDGRDRQRPLFRVAESGASEHYRPAGPARIEWAGIGPAGRIAVLAESGSWLEGRPDGVTVRVLDIATGDGLATLPEQIFLGETDRVTRAAVSERNAFVPVGGDIVSVDLATGEATTLSWSARLSLERSVPRERPSAPLAASPEAPAQGIDRVTPSPAGDALAYAMLGDIWIHDLGGESRQLTNGPALDRLPEFGPDGEQVYFARDGRLARVPALGGEVETLGPDVALEFFDSFALTPSGTHVVHPTSVLRPSLRTCAVGDSDWTTHAAGELARGWLPYPAWAGDEELVFTGAPAGERLPQVLALRLGSGKPRVLTGLERAPTRAVGSRDGRWLALLRDGRAWLAERQDTVVGEQDLRALGDVGAHSIEFGADSKRLWVAAGLDVRAFDCESAEETLRLELHPPTLPALETESLWIEGCHIVDVESGELLRDRSVLVADGRIQSIHDADTPPTSGVEDARLIDARGKYLVPGFFDMHVHQVAPAARALLAWGVTTVRQLGTAWPALLVEPELFARGHLAGPRHVSAGEIFEGIPPEWGNGFHLIESAQEARDLVERRARDGVSEVKLYPTLARDLQRATIEAAHASGVRVTSHVGSLRETVCALVDGAQCLEHWPEDLPGLHGDLLALMCAVEAAWCPTLSVRGAGDYKRRVEAHELEEPLLRASVPAAVRSAWAARDKVGPMSDANLERLLLQRGADLTRAIEAGVTVLVGSDCSLGNALIGPSTHWEMEFLVRGGLAPLDALRAATLVAARYSGRADAGIVRVGAAADLVLLEENPLEDIRATRSVLGTVVGGRFYPNE